MNVSILGTSDYFQIVKTSTLYEKEMVMYIKAPDSEIVIMTCKHIHNIHTSAILGNALGIPKSERGELPMKC